MLVYAIRTFSLWHDFFCLQILFIVEQAMNNFQNDKLFSVLASNVFCVSSSSKTRFLIVHLKKLWLLRKSIKGKFTFINTETQNVLSKLFENLIILFPRNAERGLWVSWLIGRGCAKATQETQGKVFKRLARCLGLFYLKNST